MSDAASECQLFTWDRPSRSPPTVAEVLHDRSAVHRLQRESLALFEAFPLTESVSVAVLSPQLRHGLAVRIGGHSLFLCTDTPTTYILFVSDTMTERWSPNAHSSPQEMVRTPLDVPPRGAIWVLLAIFLAGTVLPAFATPVAAGPDVSITNVTVSPEQPGPDQLTEIEVTITNTGNGSEIVEITDVYLRRQGDENDIVRIEDLGTVISGESRRIPLTASFDDPGIKNLEVSVVGKDDNGNNVQMRYPLTIVVSESEPQLNFDVNDPTVDGETTVGVNITNGEPSPIRSLNLTVNGSNVHFDNPRRIAAELGPGGEKRFVYTAQFTEQTPNTITANLSYKTAAGQHRTIRQSTTVDAAATSGAGEHPQIGLSVAEALPGTTRPVNITVANGFDHDVRQVQVRAVSPAANFTVNERVRARLAAGTDAQFSFPTSVQSAGTYPVIVTLSYTDDGVRHQVNRTFQATFDAPSNPGEVTLTGIEAVQRGGTLEVSATAGNVGSDPVEAVVVSVGSTERIGSANYFVGDIDASDFASYTLSTSVTGNVSSVPLEVRYTVDGVEKQFTTEVRVERETIQRPDPGGGPPVIPIVGGMVLLVAAALVYRWRR